MDDPQDLLASARRLEQAGRPLEAAAAYRRASGALAVHGDPYGALGARGRYARALYEGGRRAEALKVLAEADRVAPTLPATPHSSARARQARAVLDGQAARILLAERRSKEALERAYAALAAWRELNRHDRAERTAVLVGRAALAAKGARAAEPALRRLAAELPPGSPARRELEDMLAEALAPASCGHVHDTDRLVAERGGPAWGPLAFGLACGAHLAVGNGTPWNGLEDRDHDRVHALELLRESWGVTDAEDWREQTLLLLKAENSDAGVELALSLRAREGGRIDDAAWRDAVVAWCAERRIEPDAVRAVVESTRMIRRYEERFRADGLLPEDGYVRSVAAYDYGRAVAMARWGLLAGYCDRETAEEVVVRAGRLSADAYSSWEDFSAGYVLGRVLRFDDGEFGDCYTGSLTAHRILAHDPASPWRTLAWG
ncbi:DUF1266 domain-containing protein [Thermomonospora catenispora]|uniref:DUF1266 domain-containing protein n=1 Tax=Thermomonospora catenispora TaxID=2493090 RepID=UPI00111EBCEF|nr:DUF1266 domain-containing protein [Thermomonospora catenispora]TNY34606.1 DUF1266 domain-containing protein [Thermomonospora catenispora]